MKIPAGILDDHIEFFSTPQGMMAFVSGKIIAWKSLPLRVIDMVRSDLERHPEVLDQLANVPADEQLQLYAKCKFGAMGTGEPDLTSCGQSNAEYWCECTDCPIKETMRNSMPVENGTLSYREIQVAKLIAQGYLGKEISARLSISESTINTHKKHIFEKTGLTTNVDLTNWANKINLI